MVSLSSSRKPHKIATSSVGALTTCISKTHKDMHLFLRSQQIDFFSSKYHAQRCVPRIFFICVHSVELLKLSITKEEQ